MPPARKKKPSAPAGNGGLRSQAPPPPPEAVLVARYGELTRTQQRFLDGYVVTGCITRAAQAAQVDRINHYKWLKGENCGETREAYAEAFADASRVADDLLMGEARRRAYDGTRVYKFYDGAPLRDPRTGEPYFELNYSDMLMAKFLTAADPGRFREVREVKSDNTTRLTASVAAPPAPDTLDDLLGKLPIELRGRVLDALEPPPPDNNGTPG